MTSLCFAAKPVRLKGVRLGYNKEGFRMVADLTGKCTYQAHSIKDSSIIYIDLYDVVLDKKFKPPTLKQDKTLRRCLVKQYNFRQVRIEVYLKYGVPIDNFHVFGLENPRRVVLDVYRDYHNFVQFHITKNIIWLQTERAANGLFTMINELYVNYKSPDVRIHVEMAQGKNDRETVCSMVKRTGAIAGVNGGYFSKKGKSLGLVVSDGKILAHYVKKRPPRTAFGIDFDRKIYMDRVVDKKGKVISLKGRTWKNLVLAIGAGPRLLTNGRTTITAKQEGLGKGGNDITRRTGRTTLGINSKGALVLMTASGFRSNSKDGMKLTDMAKYMKSRKVVNAMNLDGGGSTAMSIMGTLVSKPPMQGKWQRPVANGLLFFDKNPVIAPRYMGIEPRQAVLPADGKSTKQVRILVADRNERPVPDGTPLSVASGIGLFEKKYYYTKKGMVNITLKAVRAPGNYSIKIDCGPLRKFLPLKLEYGDPSRIYVNKRKLEKKKIEKKGKARFIIKALVRDRYLNPLPKKVVTFKLVEGKGRLSHQKGFTRPTGVADTTAFLKRTPAKVRVESSGLPPVTVELK